MHNSPWVDKNSLFGRFLKIFPWAPNHKYQSTKARNTGFKYGIIYGPETSPTSGLRTVILANDKYMLSETYISKRKSKKKLSFNLNVSKIHIDEVIMIYNVQTVWLCVPVAWTVACHAPLSMEFSKQEYWSGLSLPTPGYLLNPGTETASLEPPSLAGGFFYH